MSHILYNYQILELICAKDSNTGHSVTYHIKKMYSMRDKYTLKVIKTSRVMLKIDIVQGRGIVQEIVRIISELNCMHKYYSTLH